MKTQGIRKIIVCTDFSPASNRAFRFSVALARRLDAEVIAVFVKNTDDLAVAMRLDIRVFRKEVDNLGEKVNAFIQRKFQALAKDPGGNQQPRIRCVILEGKVSPAILQLAKKEHADLVVTGTRSRSSISSLLLGSTARELIVNSPCPVVTLNVK